jgi:predicted NUDIX family NTP pyrophosphohydrolase
MTYIKEDDYLKLANAAAIDLVDNKVPLNDSVAKLAQQFDLNQDQIARLCEATNNTTFNHIFKNKTASDDRLVEFDVADPKIILRQQIKEAAYIGNISQNSVSELYELPNQMDQIRHPYTDHFQMEKVAGDYELIRVRVVGKGGDLQIFSVGSGLWEMPAGTVTKGEDRKTAAARILLNKTGLKTIPTQLEYIGLQQFRGKMYQTFEVDTDKLTRTNYPTDAKGNKPRIEYRKEAGFELRPAHKAKPEVDLRTLEKTTNYLHHEKLATQIIYQETLDKLATCFKRLYKTLPFEIFEKEAAAIYGRDAENNLSQLRTALRKPAVNYNWETLQKTAGYIDIDIETHKLFKELQELSSKIASCTKGTVLLNSKIQALTTELKAS